METMALDLVAHPPAWPDTEKKGTGPDPSRPAVLKVETERQGME